MVAASASPRLLVGDRVSFSGSHIEPFSLDGNRNNERSKSLIGKKDLDRAKKNQGCVAVGILRGCSIDSDI